MIELNTFAAACYEQNSIAELFSARHEDADLRDCETWGITADEWRAQIETALRERITDYLADRYDTDDVKTGDNASEDEAGLYYGEPDSWLVCGTMPNTNDDGWFFVGYTETIVREMRAEASA